MQYLNNTLTIYSFHTTITWIKGSLLNAAKRIRTEGRFEEIMEKKSFRNYAYDYLKEKILSGEYPPGRKVTISTISSELQLSNAPVREALSQLQSEGMIENVPYSGPRVPNWTRNDFYNNRLASVALYLGCYSMIRALGLREQLIQYMEEAIEAQKALTPEATALEFADTAIRVDSSFAVVLNNATVNSMFNVCRVLNYIEACSDYTSSVRDLEISIKEHVSILNAIKKDSYSDLKDALLSHLRLPNLSQNT